VVHDVGLLCGQVDDLLASPDIRMILRKSHWHRGVCKSVDRLDARLVMILAAAAILLPACASTTNGNTRTSAPVTTMPASSSSTNGNAALLQQTGVGDNTTRQFTVTLKSWTVSWSFDSCPSGGQGHFEVTVSGRNTSGGSEFPPIKFFDVSNAGTQQYPGPGTYSLMVLTPCAWSITVQP
jgi:hypothetical protein